MKSKVNGLVFIQAVVIILLDFLMTPKYFQFIFD